MDCAYIFNEEEEEEDLKNETFPFNAQTCASFGFSHPEFFDCNFGFLL